MGMPRYISKKYNSFYENLFQNKKNVMIGMMYAFVAGRRNIHRAYKTARDDIKDEKIIQDEIKHIFKLNEGINPSKNRFQQDKLFKCDYSKYAGLEKKNGEWIPLKIPVKVSRFIIDKLTKMDEEKEKTDRESIELREKILIVQNRIYASRLFPPKLKQIIFEKDNYTCQQCGRNREELINIGLHLECHHMIAWEDGGETTYKNGQTVCSECNKGIHHAKLYLTSKNKLINLE